MNAIVLCDSKDDDALSYYFATYERVIKFATALGRNL